MAVDVVDMLEHLSDLLASGDTKNVKLIMCDVQFEQLLEDKANDVIPIASYYLNEDAEQNNKSVFRYAEKLVLKCAEKGNPKECLMEFLAQIESLDQVKFQVLLKPIQVTLLRFPNRKGHLFQCVFNVIYNFLNTLPLPQYHHKDDRSKVLLECDENSRRIRSVYNLLLTFYEPFVEEISSITDNVNAKSLRPVMLQALMHLLGSPFVGVDLECTDELPSSLNLLARKIVKHILKLVVDPLCLLKLVEDRDFVTVEEEKSIIQEFSSNEIKFSDLSLSVFFYLVLSEDMCSSVPCVYDKLFIYHNCLRLAVTLLRFKEALILRKGLLLIKTVIRKIDAGSVNFSYLTFNIHKNVIELLSYVAIYHGIEEDRKLSAELIKEHFSTFEPKAQFYILLNNYSTTKHPNMVGYWTSILTGVVRNVFNDCKFTDYFTNKRLFDLLNLYCTLKKGVETDLIENKDQILSALNMVIFLIIRDRTNYTGVWNYTGRLTTNLLGPLREAIDLSRAHYKLQLRSLDDPSVAEDESKLNVTVGKQIIGQMSINEKKDVIKSGLTIFDLIEHLLSRANECVEDKPCDFESRKCDK